MKIIKKRYLALVAILVILSVLGLFWLCMSIILVTLVYWGVNYLIALIKYNFIKKLCKSIFSFLMIVIIALGIRVFITDIYFIPSLSMANTLYPKDIILVSKLKYGPNLPRSPYEIPWVNLFYYLKDSSKETMQKKIWQSKRLSGISAIKNGDIVVYKNFSKDEFFVKRCVGIAGDTLKVVEGDIYINNELYHEPKHVRKSYAFKVKDPRKLHNTIDSLNINILLYPLKREGYWRIAELSYSEIKKLERLNCIDSLKKKRGANFRNIIIPKAGMHVQLTNDVFKRYNGIIKAHENIVIKKKKNKFLVGDKIVTSYTFKKNYYFMMGDNRNDSFDSRHFGLIPEEKIVGKVSCVLFSNKDEHFQWNRLFKGV